MAIKAWRVAIWPGENPGAGAGVAGGAGGAAAAGEARAAMLRVGGAGGAAAAGGARTAMLRVATRRVLILISASNGEKGKPRKEEKTLTSHRNCNCKECSFAQRQLSKTRLQIIRRWIHDCP